MTTAATVVRAVPVAVLRPMQSAAEAITAILYGLRNEMDEDLALDQRLKWRSNKRDGAL